MRKNSETATTPAGTADPTAAALPADAVTGAVPGDGTQAEREEQDPAGGITLSGRSRAGLRARVLTGMMVTAGLVAAASGPDTTSSVTLTHIW